MHIPYDKKDINNIDLIFSEWKKKGMNGELDKRTASEGFVSVITKNWKKNDNSYVIMELHKLKGAKGFFGQKTCWVVRLLSSPTKNLSEVIMHGCVEGKNQLAAFDRAFLDVGYNFMSRTKLEDYYLE